MVAPSEWKVSDKAGRLPGTLLHVGLQKSENVRIALIDYDESSFNEKEVVEIEECVPLRDTPTVTWICMDGLHDVCAVQKLGEYFGVHPLVLEDVLNTTQRPKFEDFGDYLFIVLKAADYEKETGDITFEQMSLIVGPNYLISFHEQRGDEFELVRDRIRNAKGRIRREGPDYLAYSLLDAIVDDYFILLEDLEDAIETLEEEIVSSAGVKAIRKLNLMKRNVTYLRKAVWPVREVLAALQRNDSGLVKESTNVYLRDVYDHAIRIIETVETYRDSLAGMLEIYLSTVSNRMNDVMKVLTVIATIFIPLTFLAGVYGMNFRFMPELDWPWGYPLVVAVMVSVAAFMLFYFKKRKWF